MEERLGLDEDGRGRCFDVFQDDEIDGLVDHWPADERPSFVL